MALTTLRDHTEIHVGVHLTLTRDFPDWAWSPLTEGGSIQRDGLLAPIDHRTELLAQARTDDVAVEFRAQLEKALEGGIRVTHLDWHCLADGGREDIFDATLQLAEEYQVELRAWTDYGRRQLSSHGRVAQNQPFLDSFSVPIDDKLQHLVDAVRQLPQGLSEWAVHPAGYNPRDEGSKVHSSDYDVLMSPAFRQALEDNEITVTGYGVQASS
ncbi:ChbG/HpnK family deacetylase [Arthrobacter sp. ISL-30]|uniref:ChbG/HpnK family deacetylase n=1 Tax=Arthrobacter sp. ISL-30 TaxID=2819109 RepID=UPI001C146608|nr:ChbG/HpnK family deacetylase [Arthrobacter sp. ISL-30]MBT2512192.1 ChbG/HpnK family deacetylase [Arthrobacter sp. ISL-30]